MIFVHWAQSNYMYCTSWSFKPLARTSSDVISCRILPPVGHQHDHGIRFASWRHVNVPTEVDIARYHMIEQSTCPSSNFSSNDFLAREVDVNRSQHGHLNRELLCVAQSNLLWLHVVIASLRQMSGQSKVSNLQNAVPCHQHVTASQITMHNLWQGDGEEKPSLGRERKREREGMRWKGERKREGGERKGRRKRGGGGDGREKGR